MLGSPILYLKGMRLMMFQLSSFYCNVSEMQQLSRFAASAKSALLCLAIGGVKTIWVVVKIMVPFWVP